MGREGRRELTDGKGVPAPAPAVVLDDLVGVLRDDTGGFVFVTRNGETWRSAEALGTMSSVGPGPFAGSDATFRSVTTGARAIVGTTRDGRLLRSADYGRSFVPVDYAGAVKPYGRAIFVAVDSQGNGVLVHLPQHVFVTHDDGATWAPLPAVQGAATCAERDGEGRVYVCHTRGLASVLDGNRLRPVDRYVPIYTRQSPPDARGARERRDAKRVLVGDRVVELIAQPGEGSATEVRVHWARGGEPFSAPVPSAILVGASGLSSHLASYAADLLYLRDDVVKHGEAATSTLLQSPDDGATWHTEGTFDGLLRASYGSRKVDIATGPRGWAYVTSLCPASGECFHQRVRPAGASSFEDVELTEAFEPADFVFDETRGHVFVLGTQSAIYESPLDKNRFTRVKALDPPARASGGALTIDEAGVLHVFFYEPERQTWSVQRRDAHGAALSTHYLPFDANTAFVFAGARGLAVEPLDRARKAESTAPATPVAWETADGGETWSRVAPQSRFADHARCTVAGCFDGTRLRWGWDLPAVAGSERVVAAPEPLPRAADSPLGTASPTHAAPPRDIVCRPRGPAAVLPPLADPHGVPKLVDAGSSGARWAFVNGDSVAGSSVVLGTRTGVREVPLLLPRSVSDDVRGGSDERSNGIIAARYTTHDHWAGTSPLDVEIAWWSATTGLVVRGVLHNVPPFQVNGGFVSGYVYIVDGGLLFQPPSNPWTPDVGVNLAYLIGDDGGVRPLTLPSDVAVVGAVRIGSRLLLERAAGTPDADLAWTDDGGKSWQARTWALVDDRRRPDATRAVLSVQNGKALLGVSRPGEDSITFGLDKEIPDGPPEPRVMDATIVSTACGARVGTLRYDIPLGSDEHLRMRLETPGRASAPVVSWSRVAYATDAGRICSAAYLLRGTGAAGDAMLYPEGASWSGWSFSTEPDPNDKSHPLRKALPLTCEAAKVP